MGDAAFSISSWQSADGLTLRYRDYPGRADRPPILCIPGLTRNARDFETIADSFAGEWRVICVDLRGRGQSDYAKDPATYVPAQYVADIKTLWEQAELEQVVAIGTSLGGIVTMLLALEDADRLAGVVLNDIGPDIEQSGLDRIRDYVGNGGNYPTWMHAARALQETSAMAYPDYAMADWLRLAKRLMCLSGSGRIAYDYDMKIAEPFAETPSGPFDMWPAFAALRGRPVLAIRGEHSDILGAGTFARMEQELPGMTALSVPGVGHAPTFEEPEALAAVAALLGQVA